MYDKILVAIDQSPVAKRVLTAARDLAQLSGGEVRVLHLREREVMGGRGGTVDYETGEEARATADRAVRALAQDGIKASGEGDGIGCGLVYRWQDERNLDLVYVDTAGGFGVVQARDGELAHNVYALSPMVGVDTSDLLVLVRGGDVALYINGALVAQEQVQPGQGYALQRLQVQDVPAARERQLQGHARCPSEVRR